MAAWLSSLVLVMSGSGRQQQLLGWCWWALVNMAFLVVVCWLTAGRDPWWMGPAMSAGYSVAWFLVAHRLLQIMDLPVTATSVSSEEEEKVQTNAAVAPPEGEPTKSTNRPNPPPESCKNPNKTHHVVLRVVRYGVVVTLCLTVVGWILARRAIQCLRDDGFYDSWIDGYNDDRYGNDIPPISTNREWTTDLSRLPVNVQEWAAASTPEAVSEADAFLWPFPRPGPNAGLIYLPESRTTIFNEWTSSDYLAGTPTTIWSVSPAAPQPVALYKGRPGLEFVRVHDYLACFVVQRKTGDNEDFFGDYFGNQCTVACTDGTTVTMAAATATATTTGAVPTLEGRPPYQHRTGPRDLYVDATTGMVWYRDYYYDYFGSPKPEPLIYSLDPITMAETLHSEVRDGGDGSAFVHLELTPYPVSSASSFSSASHRFFHCERHTRAFYPIFFAIIITSLPVVVSSLYLWRQQQQGPTAGPSSQSPPPQNLLTVLVTLFAGMSALTLVLGYAVSSRNNPYGDKEAFLSWWAMCVGGAVALLCALTRMDRSDDNKNKILRWGRSIGAWLYFRWGIAVILTTSWSNHLTRDPFPWIIFNVVIVAPLTVTGLATQSFFVLLVAAAGVLLDAHNLSLNWTTHVYRHSPWLVKALITVVVTGGTGAVVTAALVYWWLRHRHPDLLAVAIAQLEAFCAPWWHRRRGTTTATGTTCTFTAVPSHGDDNGDCGKFDYQEVPSTTSATEAVAEKYVAATTRGMETMAGMLRQWADRLDQMRPTHQPDSAATA